MQNILENPERSWLDWKKNKTDKHHIFVLRGQRCGGPQITVSSLRCRDTIGHCRVPPSLCIETRLSPQPLIWKWLFIFMQIQFIFTRKVLHLASFWNWGFLELGIAYCKIRHFKIQETELTFAKTSGIVSRDRRRNWPIADRCVPVMIPETIKELISALVPFSFL